MMQVECPQCHKPRELKTDRGDICRQCSDLSRRIDKNDDGEYDHTCIDCHTEWTTKTDTRATRCRVCQGKQVGISLAAFNTKPIEEHKRYTATCTNCGLVRVLKANPRNRKTTLCGMCNRSAIGRANQIKGPKPRWFAICEKCLEGQEL